MHGERPTEVVWCEHVGVEQMFILNGPPCAQIRNPCFFVMEDSKVKLICSSCMRKALAEYTPRSA
jgi:hypothetical protein